MGSWCKLYINYDGEVAAVHMALTEVGKREDQNFAIFIDSQAAILAVSSVLPSRNGLVLDCQRMINSLINNGRNVTLPPSQLFNTPPSTLDLPMGVELPGQ
ncbi:hypothetical protein TNCT_7081 [Trichonephila clavata]|uniref:Uncharacterized protein n=1 Tax=Trichonephila clavata TaxID=2740835 RepID=A0A8X6LV99_TRICU|nr:hypothetical protein TNCT_7081 [Trichonephila clavata]